MILEVNNTVVGKSTAALVSSKLAGPLGTNVTILCLRRSGLSQDTIALLLKRDVELDESAIARLQVQDESDSQEILNSVNEDASVVKKKTNTEHKVPLLSEESIELKMPQVPPSHRSAVSEPQEVLAVPEPSVREQQQSVGTEQNKEMGTLGVMLWHDEGTSEVHIMAIKPGSSVASAGLETGDVLIQVDDSHVDATSLDSVMEKMAGPLGSTVRVTVSRTRGESVQVRETITAEVVRDVTSPRNNREPVQDAKHKYVRGESILEKKLQEHGKTELFQTKLREHNQKSSLKHFTCGFGCGFTTESEEQVEKHSFDCKFKDSTLGYTMTAQEQDRKDRTRSITPQTYHAFQHAVDGLRYKALSEKYPNAVDLHRPTSPSQEPASNDPGAPKTWQFRCLGSGKIAGKFRRGDEVVCMVKRDLSMGAVNVGDIGIVMAECLTPNAVQVRFQLGMLELDASSEVRKCLYQDILRIERERKKQADVRQKILEETIAKQRREKENLKKTTTLPISTHAKTPQLAHTQSMAAPKTKDSFMTRITRSFSTREK